MPTEITEADVRVLRSDANLALDRARVMAFSDQDDYDYGAEVLRNIKALSERIEAHYRPMIQAAYDAHKKAVAARDEHAKPLNEARLLIGQKMADWKIADEARRKAEASLREEENRKKAEDARLADAEALAKAGRKEEAEAALAAPVLVPVATVEEAPKTAGISITTRWKGEAVNMALFIKWLAQPGNEGYVELVKADSAKINALARSTKGKLIVPGVRFFAESGVTNRG